MMEVKIHIIGYEYIFCIASDDWGFTSRPNGELLEINKEKTK